MQSTQECDLNALADDLLAQAAASSHGRAARTVTGGPDRVLRQTLMALREGAELSEHTAPGDATLHVLRGRVRLHTVTASSEGTVGTLMTIPAERHGLTALADSVVLLTVVLSRADAATD